MCNCDSSCKVTCMCACHKYKKFPNPVIYQAQLEVNYESFETVLTTFSRSKAKQKQNELRSEMEDESSVRICSYVVEDIPDDVL